MRRFEDRLDEARSCAGETTCRMWRFSMAASAHRLATGRLNVYQTLLLKAPHGTESLPLTRADWYRDR
jgi:cyclopropane fatty-acyl-phospholipid synthase-like methyltransferase